MSAKRQKTHNSDVGSSSSSSSSYAEVPVCAQRGMDAKAPAFSQLAVLRPQFKIQLLGGGDPAVLCDASITPEQWAAIWFEFRNTIMRDDTSGTYFIQDSESGGKFEKRQVGNPWKKLVVNRQENVLEPAVPGFKGPLGSDFTDVLGVPCINENSIVTNFYDANTVVAKAYPYRCMFSGPKGTKRVNMGIPNPIPFENPIDQRLLRSSAPPQDVVHEPVNGYLQKRWEDWCEGMKVARPSSAWTEFFNKMGLTPMTIYAHGMRESTKAITTVGNPPAKQEYKYHWIVNMYNNSVCSPSNVSLSEQKCFYFTKGVESQYRRVFNNLTCRNDPNTVADFLSLFTNVVTIGKGISFFKGSGKKSVLHPKLKWDDADDAAAKKFESKLSSQNSCVEAVPALSEGSGASPGIWVIFDAPKMPHSVLVIIKDNIVFTIGAGVIHDASTFGAPQTLLVLSPDDTVYKNESAYVGSPLLAVTARSSGFYNKGIEERLKQILRGVKSGTTTQLTMDKSWKYRMVASTCPISPISRGGKDMNCTALALWITGTGSFFNTYVEPKGTLLNNMGLLGCPKPNIGPAAISGDTEQEVPAAVACTPATAYSLFPYPRESKRLKTKVRKREGGGKKKTRRKRHKKKRRTRYKRSNPRKKTRRRKKRRRKKRRTRR